MTKELEVTNNASSSCGTCRHWGKPGDTHDYRQCKAIIHDTAGQTDASFDAFESADWLDEDDKEEIRNVRKAKAVCVDGSGYIAAVRCRSDFGCCLWEQKQ